MVSSMAESPPRLDLIWNWLPPFRAVAETEHLPTAAKQLNVTASALSRSVRLLEDALGQQLFHRVGRTIVLNAAGRRLLEAMAACNRTLDATLTDLVRPGLNGELRLASVGVLTHGYVLPAILKLVDDNPVLIPSLENHLASAANERLAKGAIDAAFYYDAIQHPDLRIEPIGQSFNSVYCGVGHPLFERADIDETEILQHPFTAPHLGDRQLPMDGWPVDIPRTVGLRITLLVTNLEVALSGQFLAVLPDVTAADALEAGRLRRLPFERLRPQTLYAARRSGDSTELAAEQVIAAVKDRIEAVDARLNGIRSGPLWAGPR